MKNINTIEDIILALEDIDDNGINNIDGDDFHELIDNSLEIFKCIKKYTTTHDLALSCGGEFVWQSDKGQLDAINLTCEILEVLQDYAEELD